MRIDHLVSVGDPRVHPNGFIQLDLNGEGTRRLHIWDPRLPRQNTRTSIHDHIFDMRSRILYGSLNQVLYKFDLEHFGKPTHEIYMASYKERSSSILEPTGVRVKAREEKHLRNIAGQEYWQPAFTFHDSIPVGPTVYGGTVATVMTKSITYEGSPRVMVPVGKRPHNDFDRKAAASTDFLWNVIQEILELMSADNFELLCAPVQV